MISPTDIANYIGLVAKAINEVQELGYPRPDFPTSETAGSIAATLHERFAGHCISLDRIAFNEDKGIELSYSHEDHRDGPRYAKVTVHSDPKEGFALTVADQKYHILEFDYTDSLREAGDWAWDMRQFLEVSSNV